jgi:hypothetical protein
MKETFLILLTLGSLNNIYAQMKFEEIRFQKISTEEGLLLIQNKKAKKIVNTMLKQYEAQNGFILPDSTVVLFWEDKVCKAPFEDIFNYSIQLDNTKYSPPSPEEIISKQEEYLQSFYNYFGKEDWDFSLKSLEKIDKLYPILEDSGISESELLFPLIIYLGEVLKKETNGYWIVKQVKDPYPIIKGKNGKEYDSYIRVHKILSRSHNPFAFYSAIDSQLNPIKLYPADKKVVPYNPFNEKNK